MSLQRGKSGEDMQRRNKAVLQTESEWGTEAWGIFLQAGPGCLHVPIPVYFPTVTTFLLQWIPISCDQKNFQGTETFLDVVFQEACLIIFNFMLRILPDVIVRQI